MWDNWQGSNPIPLKSSSRLSNSLSSSSPNLFSDSISEYSPSAEVDLEGVLGCPPHPPRPLSLFCNHQIFCDHFEELQTVLTDVKLIINSAPLTYVYPNTIKTYLTTNHLLLGRQLLFCSNTISTVVSTLIVLSSTTDRIDRISNHFWHRWGHEYVVSLRETQRASKLTINSQKIMLCQFITKRCPDIFGELSQ